jgi:hypothetical protein
MSASWAVFWSAHVCSAPGWAEAMACKHILIVFVLLVQMRDALAAQKASPTIWKVAAKHENHSSL